MSRTIKTLFGAFSIALISMTLHSCFGVPAALKREFTEKHNAIPPEFGKEGTTFIVMLRGRGSYDKYAKGATKKYYKGDYVFLNPKKESLEDAKYADKSKYRYYFDYTDGSSSTVFYSNGQSSTATAKRFYVYDRLEGKKYQSGGESGMFGKVIKAYMGNLELKRKSMN